MPVTFVPACHPTARSFRFSNGRHYGTFSFVAAGPRNQIPEERIVRPRNAGAPRVLSIGQERLWYLGQLSPSAYNVTFSNRIHGPLRLDLLQEALNIVVRRHEVLRTLILPVGGKPVPILLNRWDVKVTRVDLRKLPAHERQAEAERLMLAESSLPFNYSRDLMLRAVVIQLDDEDFIFLHSAPHLAFEAPSAGLLLAEISEIYNAAQVGREHVLPDLPVQYADFAQWQRCFLQGERLERLMQFWSAQLFDPPTVDLPADFPRPAVHSMHGGRRYFDTPLPLMQQANQFFRTNGTTMYRGLCAACFAFLHVYTGLTDLTLGSPFAPRCTGIENLIGFFVNTVVLRADLSGDPNFHDVIKRVDAIVRAAIENSDLTFDKMVEAAHLSRDPSRSPLFQVNFRAPKNPYPVIELRGCSAERTRYLNNDTAKFDFAIEVDSSVGESSYFEYYSDLFEEPTAHRMAVDFVEILAGLISQPDMPLSKLPAARAIRDRLGRL